MYVILVLLKYRKTGNVNLPVNFVKTEMDLKCFSAFVLIRTLQMLLNT